MPARMLILARIRIIVKMKKRNLKQMIRKKGWKKD